MVRLSMSNLHVLADGQPVVVPVVCGRPILLNHGAAVMP